MKCKDCSFWQGTRVSEWGDCNRVVGMLEPNLLSCYREEEENPGVRFYLRIPLDPHEIEEYWTHHPFVRKLRKNAEVKASKYGVRVDRDGKLRYFVTHKDFDCEVIDEDK